MQSLWLKAVSLFTAILIYLTTLFSGGGGTVKPLTTPNQLLPAFRGGLFLGGFESSGSTVIDKYKFVSVKDYERYVSRLEQSGFTCYDSREIEQNRFATFTNEQFAIHLSFYPDTRIMRVVVEQKGALCRLTDPYETVCDTLLTGMKGETVVAAEGMGFILRLADGSFCVIDGGMGDPDGVDADKLMNILLAQKPEGTGKPVIAAWIFTHLHGDHIGVFNCFSLAHHDDVTIEQLIFNFPKEEEVQASDSPYMIDDTIYRYT